MAAPARRGSKGKSSGAKTSGSGEKAEATAEPRKSTSGRSGERKVEASTSKGSEGTTRSGRKTKG